MKRIICLICCLSVLVALVGCGNIETQDTDTSNTSQQETTVEPTEQPTTEEPTTEVTEPEPLFKYDEVVNAFLVNFTEKSDMEIRDIKQGNIRTKCFLYIGGQYTELLNATENVAETFNITINGGNEEGDVEKIVTVFTEVVKVLDPSITDDVITAAINEHIYPKEVNREFDLSDAVHVKFYPMVELSTYTTDCRIEITTTIYN